MQTFREWLREAFAEPQKQWKNKYVVVNNTDKGLCYDATIYGDEIVVILKTPEGKAKPFIFDKNNIPMKIDSLKVTQEEFIKAFNDGKKKLKKNEYFFHYTHTDSSKEKNKELIIKLLEDGYECIPIYLLPSGDWVQHKISRKTISSYTQEEYFIEDLKNRIKDISTEQTTTIDLSKTRKI